MRYSSRRWRSFLACVPEKSTSTGLDAVNLLKRLRLIVADGHHQRQEIGMVVGDLGQQLDEVEGPVAPRVLLCVGQAVIPRLELVQQQRGGWL